ncbi:TatD family hydrolase [Pelistega ratti]|uniref:TatD family hydrolase n=1 Tax=Pelistega ratti TaxID=2652177 RepID=UPI0013569F55|nr:TatD family hydrolase [Pelistega ratti]
MLIDTHCHLDAPEFDTDRMAVIEKSLNNGVTGIVIPAVMKKNLGIVKALAAQFKGGYYALGIHPMYVRYAKDEDLADVELAIQSALDNEDIRLVAIGEIGLDFFVPEISTGIERERQLFFYKEQLKMAKKYQLPVLLHVRRSQDMVLKYLRQLNIRGGIAHAFNGSEQQAKAFIEQGFCLGFGGTMTFTRSLQIRRLVTQIDMQSIVLETDAPDIPPAWLSGDNRRNSPENLPRIAQVLADLRGMSLDDIQKITTQNALRIMPRMQLSYVQ